MAQIPKLYSPTLAQTTAATRTQPPIRSTSSTRVASIDPQVTELNTGFAAANLDTAPFTFSGDHPPEHGQERQGREKAPNNRALLMISSTLWLINELSISVILILLSFTLRD